MEVSRRPVHSARGLRSAAGARARGWIGPALALGATLAAALAVLVAQPVRSPWWTYADADATYVGAGLDLLLGEPGRYLDHPGLPLEEGLAVVFGVGELADRATGGPGGREYVDGLLLNPERTKPVFRGLAILVYVAGALAAAALMARMLGGWFWGLAGGLLWTAAPGLLAMSIQYRPDVPLAALCVVFAYLVARAVETRSALLYAAAAAGLGLAVMVKLHAAGLLPALALAALWRPPQAGWQAATSAELRELWRRHRSWLVVLLGAWVAAALALNIRRIPFTPTAEQLTATLVPPLFTAAWFLLTRAPHRRSRFRDPFHPFVAAAFLAGLYAPLTLDLADGMQALVRIGNGLVGRGVNSGVVRFGSSFDVVADTPLLVFLALAAAAAVIGIRARDPRPAVWLTGAAGLTALALARPVAPHYLAPAFLLAVPPALWLFARPDLRRSAAGSSWRALASLVAAVLVVYTAGPALRDRHSPAQEADAFAASAAPAVAALEARLRPGEVALVPSNWPTADSRYFQWLANVVAYSPDDYPYRFLPALTPGAELARRRGLRLRYYAGPETERITGTGTIGLGELGRFRARRLPGLPVVELLSGPT